MLERSTRENERRRGRREEGRQGKRQKRLENVATDKDRRKRFERRGHLIIDDASVSKMLRNWAKRESEDERKFTNETSENSPRRRGQKDSRIMYFKQSKGKECTKMI